MKQELILASNNPHKVEEIMAIAGNRFVIKNLSDIGYPDEIPENEPTLEGNALSKARTIHAFSGGNVFADDTGLEVDELNGAPGVHSARFAGEEKNSSANIKLLLESLENKDVRTARFRSVIALIWEGKEYLFEGIVEGMITENPRGKNGFGYDPVFIPDGYDKTFAELPDSVKNMISHRSIATGKMICFFQDLELQ